ncbi:TPA: HigA family addiction module antidote protein [Klebsiella variicola subsp. variicola]|nr:HigA family addiction module antidote protein [Klebsiella variicola subsp. variicola]HCI4627475.1 HigA family addiction module antidote protein [Klebsiella variicola subsp. variicola]HCI6660958.1 HigA family addiction module antidote protein [Klebsiella variicola subsp. variicola]
MINRQRPATPGQVLLTKYLEPRAISQTSLAEHTGWTRKHVNQICHGKTTITPEAALILARVLGTDAGLWLKLQQEVDLWDAMHTPERIERINRAQPLQKFQAA